MKKLLFGPKDAQSGEIARAFSECGRREIVAAAFAVAEKYVKLYELAEERNGDGRVRVALGTAKLWAKGVVKMPYAKAKILDAHAAARAAYSPVATAAARAVAQAASAVHSPRHVMGAVYYGLTAVALAKGGDLNCEEVEAEKARILQTIDRIKADPLRPTVGRTSFDKGRKSGPRRLRKAKSGDTAGMAEADVRSARRGQRQ